MKPFRSQELPGTEEGAVLLILFLIRISFKIQTLCILDINQAGNFLTAKDSYEQAALSTSLQIRTCYNIFVTGNVAVSMLLNLSVL